MALKIFTEGFFNCYPPDPSIQMVFGILTPLVGVRFLNSLSVRMNNCAKPWSGARIFHAFS
jgi:hypothetical protein